MVVSPRWRSLREMCTVDESLESEEPGKERVGVLLFPAPRAATANWGFHDHTVVCFLELVFSLFYRRFYKKNMVSILS